MSGAGSTRVALWRARLQRWRRWEFWPMWVLYTVPFIYIVFLCLRYRGLRFMAANPTLPASGFIGEQKQLGLRLFQQSAPDFVARFALLPVTLPLEQRLDRARDFMRREGLSFPVVLKPDSGQRGLDVAVIRSAADLQRYLEIADVDSLLQEHIADPEFGVFWLRDPDTGQGRIFSLTHKTFPAVVGDGLSTLKQLILSHPRTRLMADYLLELHAADLGRVPADGECVPTVEIGSHCRGSLFLDACDRVTPELEARMEKLCAGVPGFCFGRFDIRAPDEAAFFRGESFRILEVNGVTSEATHIYDPKHGLFHAWGVLCRQWEMAFSIGAANMRAGHPAVSLRGLFGKLREMNS